MYLRLEKGTWYSPAKLSHIIILIIGVLSALSVVTSIVMDKLGFNV